ncbi:hypothetical protein HWD32_gp76 [Gordonia phage Secretariat]|uniref:DUF7352 domain-containing protein n=1 Tax=Gordonia phage Secretariat TaxID=2725616 RepID=A0A6M3T6T7_9CAUD|nr:hypothetical protein HWD32_gp76 [Gordonia phage Secretariat]QJD49651.1 hypothetical protein SEA_SECRETARIAT_76 [Gordonia phage Secretariat]
MHTHNGTRILTVPLSMKDGPQEMTLGSAKVLMATEGPKSTKTIDLHYEVDTASYEFFIKTSQTFYIVNNGARVPENSEHVTSLVLRSGDPVHIYRKVESDMEYTLRVVDESLSHTLIEGYANSSGMGTTLKCFTTLDGEGRNKFMDDLLWNGAAEHKASREDPFPYTVTATLATQLKEQE